MQQSNDPGLGAYYDRAKERTAGSMNSQLAAMGLLGSSVGANKMGDALSGLDADRANREADFVMRQNQMFGQMGSAADSQNQGQMGLGGQMSGNAQEMGMNRGQLSMNAAQNVDTMDINRFNAGMNAAQSAQGARRERGQDMFGNVYGPAAAMAGMVGDAQNDVLANDAQYLDAAAAAELGLVTDMQNTDRHNADRQKEDENHGLNAMGQIWGMGAGGGGAAAAGGGGK